MKFVSQRGIINPEKRRAMEQLLRDGASMETVARELGYKTAGSAATQAWHWGLHHLSRSSHYSPARPKRDPVTKRYVEARAGGHP